MPKRRAYIRVDLHGATKTAAAHREAVQPPKLVEAKNVVASRSSGYLQLRPDFGDFSERPGNIFAGNLDEFQTGSFTDAGGNTIAVTNVGVWAKAPGGASYSFVSPEVASVTASNSAGSNTITLASAETSAPLWVGFVVVFSGESEYYRITSASTTQLTVDRNIASAHSGATLSVRAAFHGEASKWPLKRATFTQTEILKPERIVGEVTAEDVAAPIAITPSKFMTVAQNASPEDAFTTLAQLGPEAPGSLTATAVAGGSLAAGTYYYVVAVKDPYGRGDLSIEASATADATNGTIQLSWSAVGGASTYRVYRGTSTGNYTEYYDTASTAMSDDGSISWTAGTPANDEYRTKLRVAGLTGDPEEQYYWAFCADTTGPPYIIMRLRKGTDDGFYPYAPGTDHTCHSFSYYTVQRRTVIAVAEDVTGDILLSIDSGQTWSSLSPPFTPSSDDLMSVNSARIYYVDKSASALYVYDFSDAAWTAVSTDSRIANATHLVAGDGSTGAHICFIVGSGFILRYLDTGPFAGSLDTVSSNAPFTSAAYAFQKIAWVSTSSGSQIWSSLVKVIDSAGVAYTFVNSGNVYTQDESELSQFISHDMSDGLLSGDSISNMVYDLVHDNLFWGLTWHSPIAMNTSSGNVYNIVDSGDGLTKLVSFFGKPTALGSANASMIGATCIGAWKIWHNENMEVLIAGGEGGDPVVVYAPWISLAYRNSTITTYRKIKYNCATFAVAGSYVVLGAVSDDDGYRERRVRWSVPGTFDTWSGEGAGFADLPGHGRIVSLVTIEPNVVVFEEHRIGLLAPRGIIDEPWSYRVVAEGIRTVSNPVRVSDKVYFIADDGLLYFTNGVSVERVQTGFDATKFSDFTSTTRLCMAYDENTQSLVILDAGSTEAHLVNPQTGTWTTWDLPRIGGSGPDMVFTTSGADAPTLCFAYNALDSSSNLVVASAQYGTAPRGYDSVASTTEYWHAEIQTGAIDLTQRGSRTTIRGATLETYASDDSTAPPRVAVQVRSSDTGTWRDAGDANGTMTVGTSSVTGSGTAWSNKIGSGDGATTAFTAPVPGSRCRVYLYDTATGTYTLQTEGADYAVSGNTITFSLAPATGTDVYVFWDSEPAVKVSAGDFVKTSSGIHKVTGITDATTMALDWYPASSTSGIHLPARQMPAGDGEVDVGVDALCDRCEVRIYLKAEDDAGASTIAEVKAIRLAVTADGREQEDAQ